jgi:hypothetical protein
MKRPFCAEEHRVYGLLSEAIERYRAKYPERWQQALHPPQGAFRQRRPHCVNAFSPREKADPEEEGGDDYIGRD